MENFLNKPDAGAAPQKTGAAKATQRHAEVKRDAAMHTAKPGPNPGLKQIDGNQSTLGNRPTRASLQDRATSSGESRSGMESAMGALADKEHPRRFKGRRT